ncbi:MAG TPA: hypothetical protein VHA11_05015 [Bryobacteraceae bacterium]|nr:hypothetical protein [Bryobacteraceae bacterium]
MTPVPLPGAKRDLRASLIIGLLCLLVYNANGRAISAGDAFPARYQPFAIWRYRTVLLDPIETVASQGRERPQSWQKPHPGAAFWMVPAPGGHLVSLYSVVLPVLISPFYLPAVAYVHHRGWTDAYIDRAARIMEKVIASFAAALSASLLYLALRRRATASIATLLTIAYAFGTTTWVISSQALWQHGMAQLLMVGLILLLTAPCTVPRALAAGLLCGLIAGNRPADAVLAAALGVYGLFWAGRRAPLVGVAALVPAVAVLFYNLTVVGALGGAYQLVGRTAFFQHDMSSGLAGLLFSPTRGLFVFSPFLLFLVFAWRCLPRDRAERGLTLAMIAGVIVQVLLYSKIDWRAGISWGPRFLTDLLPLLIWLLAPVVAALRRPGRACFIAAVVIAIGIESVGAFAYTGVTDLPIYAVAGGPDKLRAAWDWRNAPFVASLSRGLAPPELTLLTRGTIDALALDGRATDTIVPGQDVVATGWALAGLATPVQVGITIDGLETTAVRTFTDRPDVRRAFPGAGLAGWRIPLKTSGLAPGKHRLSLYLWASEKGEAYFLTVRTLTVLGAQAPSAGAAQPGGSDLDASFRTAAARIREHQQGPGYWLTAFTRAARFEEPHQEMNTYLTSLLVDLLDPVAAAGLGDSVQRARRHLTAQIEPSGLVRYHGLPDAPGIGTLGCAITPDTDDTALVWRIAPGQDRQRLSAALATIDRYRTRDGLYRSWLAPREAYQCLDPGSDPNPADAGIQLHLLQLLLRERPASGRALCEALRRHIDDDRIWVYYRLSPLVPILRTEYLERAGCHLELPASRMRTTVPEQQIWVSVVQLLSRGSQPGVPRPDAAEVTTVLRRLANDDFALVRQNPPLLYHNDLTATVPRYYWSEDAGYALWLRLAQEFRHR